MRRPSQKTSDKASEQQVAAYGQNVLASACLRLFAEKKNVHDHHRKKIIWKTFLASKRNTFQVGGGYQNPMKTRKTISTTESFLCGPHFFWQRKVLHWSRAVYAFFFPVFGQNRGVPEVGSGVENEFRATAGQEGLK